MWDLSAGSTTPPVIRTEGGGALTGEKLAVAVGAALGGAASWTSHARGGPARGRRSLAAPLERARPGLAAQDLGAAVLAGPSRRRSHCLRAAAAPHPCARSRSLAGLARRRFRCPCTPSIRGGADITFDVGGRAFRHWLGASSSSSAPLLAAAARTRAPLLPAQARKKAPASLLLRLARREGASSCGGRSGIGLRPGATTPRVGCSGARHVQSVRR